MRIITAEDRNYLENKYHRTDEPFDAYNRMAYHGYEYDPSTGMTDEEMRVGLEDLSKRLEGLPHPVQKARMFEYVLDNTRIDVNEHDYFVGIYTWNRPISKFTLHKWHDETLEKHCGDDIAHLKLAADAGMHYGGGKSAGYSPLDFDHTVPDWDSLMALGFPGILKRIEESRKRHADAGTFTEGQEAFYWGVKIEYEAILRLLDRLYDYACSKTFEKAPKIAECLKNLRDGAPKSAYDAMQMIYLYFMLSESVEHYQVRSLGHGLDATLLPFFRNDISEGRFTRDDIAELLSYFLMQWSAIGNYWGQPFYLGGTNLDGTTRVNELSRLILEVYDKLGIYNPKIQIKVGRSTPKDFIMQALEMIRGGNSSIVFCSEDHIVRAMMSRGATYEEALDAVISGCYEYKFKAGSVNISSVYPNPLKPISLVFDDGFDRFSGKQIGPKTGDVCKFTDFGQFYRAYITQLTTQIKIILDATNNIEAHNAGINPSLMFSGTLPDCVATLTDALEGGVRNESEIIFGGIGTAVDALMAVYELVFENRVTTLAELKDALEKNWEGYELLHRKALSCKHKYGNGDYMADQYARAIMRHVCAGDVAGRKNAHGGFTTIDGHSARAFLIHGSRTLATPDGRKAGEEMSKNVSPTPGQDRSGITALIRSANTLDSDLFNSGMCLDAMLHPSAVQGAEGLEALYGVLMGYVRGGGGSIHFNIFNPEILRDAQEHPENYKNLQVRVCGWNQLWNNMDKVEQDAYILRAENI
ncbi:MAG: pyruvate formate lyase family protein [Christensenellales bacterium]|jgi:pyruvate-formate lyase